MLQYKIIPETNDVVQFDGSFRASLKLRVDLHPFLWLLQLSYFPIQLF